MRNMPQVHEINHSFLTVCQNRLSCDHHNSLLVYPKIKFFNFLDRYQNSIQTLKVSQNFETSTKRNVTSKPERSRVPEHRQIDPFCLQLTQLSLYWSKWRVLSYFGKLTQSSTTFVKNLKSFDQQKVLKYASQTRQSINSVNSERRREIPRFLFGFHEIETTNYKLIIHF